MKTILNNKGFIFFVILLTFFSCKKTETNPEIGNLTDFEGNEYQTVKIGEGSSLGILG